MDGGGVFLFDFILKREGYINEINTLVYTDLSEGEKPVLLNARSIRPQTIAAHFDGNEYTEDELEEIKKFAEFVKQRRNKQ